MNEKELAEIRRRFRPEKGNITRVRGCYVNEKNEIISEFNQPLGMMTPQESEALLTILKRTLSGTVGKNLINIEFSNGQVLEGDEHKLLMALKSSGLTDDNAVNALYDRIIGALNFEGNYMIVLAHDTYDVPSFSKDGEQEDFSSEVFSYILCSICPVKMPKPALTYYVHENRFRNMVSDWVLSSPELGFMFPAFIDRRGSIYEAVYYNKNIAENHIEFSDAIFKTELPMPAASQKEAFHSILAETISEDCNLEVAAAVRDEFCVMIEEHKANKSEEPPQISKQVLKGALQSCGVSEQRITAFEEKYDTVFGENAVLCPQNIVEPKQFQLSTPDVSIKVNPNRRDLVETKVIDGRKYILIRADEGVEVNGVSIHIS